MQALCAIRWPVLYRGAKIGLMGGTFDPPHEGHVHLARLALKWCRLDAVWWLIAPLNPLKRDAPPLLELASRVRKARLATGHPRISVTGLEDRLGSSHSAASIALIRKRWPQARFLWVMGSDSFAGLREWRNMRQFIGLVPLAVFARPPCVSAALYGPAAVLLKRHRRRRGRMMVLAKPPAWVYFHTSQLFVSSTARRRLGCVRQGGEG